MTDTSIITNDARATSSTDQADRGVHSFIQHTCNPYILLQRHRRLHSHTPAQCEYIHNTYNMTLCRLHQISF